MQKWNIQTDRAQRKDEKNGVSCLIMFASEVMVVKMSKMAHLSVFSADASKTSVRIWRKYLDASGRSYLALLENAMDCWIWATISKISTFEDIEFHYFLLTQWFFDIFILNNSRTVTPKPINHTIFWKNSKRSFRYT